ncbi:hypothetical protein ACWEKM_13845 [Streptomyces sp. NPDC004752]
MDRSQRTGYLLAALTAALSAVPGITVLPSAARAADVDLARDAVPEAQYTLPGYVRGPYVYLGGTGTGLGADTAQPSAARSPIA